MMTASTLSLPHQPPTRSHPQPLDPPNEPLPDQWHVDSRSRPPFGGRVFCFRIPFTMPRQRLLGLPEDRFSLHDDGEHRVWLRSSAIEAPPLSEATNLVIRGEGYASKTQAAVEGEMWRDVISRAFARLHLAADFGDRLPFASLTEAGEAWLSARHGSPVLADRPGVTVFEDQPGLRFVSSRADARVRAGEDSSRQALSRSAQLQERLLGPERLAFDLYSGSFFQPSSDSRLLMLMMAVETLIDPLPRSLEARRHVSTLIQATEANPDLTPSEHQSLQGSLRWLMSESIGQAGRRLVRRLEPRRYMGKPPAVFFTGCYEVRSALAHGHVPRPNHVDVGVLAAGLEALVGDLLAGRLLDAPPT